MADWVIGDLHGCLTEFEQLLERLALDTEQDSLWLTGDIVNRGPDSLQTLQRVHALSAQMGPRFRLVLGNHDLHLLACWAGLRKPRTGDTLESILQADEADRLCHWLRTQPFIHRDNSHILVHAGLYPGVSLSTNVQLAAALNAALAGEHYIQTLKTLYQPARHHYPADENDDLKLNFAAAAFTRMRFLDKQLALDFHEKGKPNPHHTTLQPWYRAAETAFPDLQIHTGHWAALGYVRHKPVVALDGGCAWGGELIAIRRDQPQHPISIKSQSKKYF